MMPNQQNHRNHPSSSRSNTNGNSNTQRRIFRGRGGATDRQNLPKFNAARRRRHESLHESVATNDIDIDITNHEHDENHVTNDDYDHLELYRLEIIDPFVPVVVVDESTTNGDANDASTSPRDTNSSDTNDSLTQHVDRDDDEVFNSKIKLLQKEVQHITRRIQNLRQNWSKSKTGIIIVTTYQTNVIQASLNIIMKEWKSILNKYHYFHKANGSINPNENNAGRQHEQLELLLRSVSHEIFLLIQHSIQCGPLTGSQPGYFKRCGGEVAHIVYEYLSTILPTTNHTTTATTSIATQHNSGGIEVVTSTNLQYDLDDDNDDYDGSDDPWREETTLNSDDNDDEEDDDSTTIAEHDDQDTATLPHQQNKSHPHEEQQQLPNNQRNGDVIQVVTLPKHK
jgi:hypothetical protein